MPVAMMQGIIDHLASALPHEGCGLIAVSGAGEAVKFYAGTNIDRSTTRYTMEPAEVLAAFKEMRANEWELGAIVHSHPASEPRPSPTDRLEAYYPDALMLIVSFAAAKPEARAWLVPGTDDASLIVEVEINLVPPDRDRRISRERTP